MIQTSSVSEAIADSSFIDSPVSAPRQSAPIAVREPVDLFLPILTASLTLHLLIVALVGSGVTQSPEKLKRVAPSAPPPPIIEQVNLEPEPVVPPPPKQESVVPTPDEPQPAAALDLPPLPQIQPIAAVSALVPVSFSIAVKGPVRLVADASQASGGGGGQRGFIQPISLDTNGQRNLLLPAISYPYEAKRRRLTGTVSVEFHTSPTGDIYDVRVREASGHDILDRAAIENLQHGRWIGQPGYYIKAYEFSLK
jgi:protein TonB